MLATVTTAIKSLPCFRASGAIAVPFISVYFTSRRRLFDKAGRVSFSSCVLVIKSTFKAPLPLFFTVTEPPPGATDNAFSNTALADFTAGCCLPYIVQVKSRVPDNFSANRPIAINANAVDCVLNQSSRDKFFETFCACVNASRSRPMSNKVSNIMASSRSYEPYT